MSPPNPMYLPSKMATGCIFFTGIALLLVVIMEIVSIVVGASTLSIVNKNYEVHEDFALSKYTGEEVAGPFRLLCADHCLDHFYVQSQGEIEDMGIVELDCPDLLGCIRECDDYCSSSSDQKIKKSCFRDKKIFC